MLENLTKEQAKERILTLVEEYYNNFMQKAPYKEGDRISYAGRVFDAEEMKNRFNQ